MHNWPYSRGSRRCGASEAATEEDVARAVSARQFVRLRFPFVRNIALVIEYSSDVDDLSAMLEDLLANQEEGGLSEGAA